MSSPSIEIFPKFGINKPHKFILYTASTIFLTSLFFEIKSNSPKLIQVLMLVLIAFGIFFWFIIKIIEDSITNYEIHRESYREDEKIKNCYISIKILEGIYSLISVIILVFLAYHI